MRAHLARHEVQDVMVDRRGGIALDGLAAQLQDDPAIAQARRL